VPCCEVHVQPTALPIGKNEEILETSNAASWVNLRNVRSRGNCQTSASPNTLQQSQENLSTEYQRLTVLLNPLLSPTPKHLHLKLVPAACVCSVSSTSIVMTLNIGLLFRHSTYLQVWNDRTKENPGIFDDSGMPHGEVCSHIPKVAYEIAWALYSTRLDETLREHMSGKALIRVHLFIQEFPRSLGLLFIGIRM
jgi:hypothetical protein